MGKNTNFVSHKKSKLKENGGPKLPLATDLVEGEIAINFGKDVETLSIKNESGDVVTFSSDNYYTEKKLGSGFTGENSANTVTSVIESNEKVTALALADLDEKKLDASAYTPTMEIWVSGSGVNSAVLKGGGNTASGKQSVAMGSGTTASGDYSVAEGLNTTASGQSSHAEGNGARAIGQYSHAEGKSTTASGECSHAEGKDAQASRDYSHAEGLGTKANGGSSHAEGNYTTASGFASHAEGYSTTASGGYSHAEGQGTTASGGYSHVEGSYTTASGDYSHAEGNNTKASGSSSHAEGSDTKATGNYSHAEGSYAIASGNCSHAEGDNTKAIGYNSHAEGQNTTASGNTSHAEGYNTTASGGYSHAEGGYTTASGYYSHTEGNYIQANGDYSHAEGSHTVANNQSEHASGQYNISNSASTTFGDSGNTLFSVGNGTAYDARHNAFEIRQNGDIYITSGSSDIKLQDYIGSVETVTAITPSNSGSTDPIATKVVAENELTVSNALNDLDIRKLNISNFNTYSGGVDTAINSKASQSDLTALSGTVTGHTSNTNIHLTTTEKTNLVSLATNIGTISGITSTDKLIHETMNRRTRTDFTSKGLEWFKTTLKSAIADKSLEKYGLKVGDYCSATHDGKTYNYVIAGLNTMRGSSTPYRLNYDHVGIIVDTNDTHAWNTAGNTSTSQNKHSTDGIWASGTSAAGYASCDLQYYLEHTVLPNVESDLGASNLKGHSKLYSNAVNTSGYNRFGSNGGCSSSWDWYTNQKICALSEVQVYGSIVWSSSGYDTGEACRQLDVFRVYNMNEIFGGRYPWLRDVASASYACFVYGIGVADNNTASNALYVAALILFA